MSQLTQDNTHDYWLTFCNRVNNMYTSKTFAASARLLLDLGVAPLQPKFLELYNQVLAINTAWHSDEKWLEHKCANRSEAIRAFTQLNQALFDEYPMLARRILDQGVDPRFLSLSFMQAQEIQKVRSSTEMSTEKKQAQVEMYRKRLTQFFAMLAVSEARQTKTIEKAE